MVFTKHLQIHFNLPPDLVNLKPEVLTSYYNITTIRFPIFTFQDVEICIVGKRIFIIVNTIP